MIYTAITDATGYFGRAAVVSLFNPGSGSADSYPVHVLRTIGMFLVTGDPNERHDVGALPLAGTAAVRPVRARHLALLETPHRPRSCARADRPRGVPAAAAHRERGAAPHFLRSLGLAALCGRMHRAWLRRGDADRCERLGARARRRNGPRIATGAAWAVCAAAVTGVGIASAVTYMNRPIADRYSAFTFADVALANAAVDNSTGGGASTLLILDKYDAMDVQFLDAGRLPTIVAPRRPVANPAIYSLIVAPSRADIAAAVGAELAAQAQVVARDPSAIPSRLTWYPSLGCSDAAEPQRATPGTGTWHYRGTR